MLLPLAQLQKAGALCLCAKDQIFADHVDLHLTGRAGMWMYQFERQLQLLAGAAAMGPGQRNGYPFDGQIEPCGTDRRKEQQQGQ